MNLDFDFTEYVDSSMLATYKACPRKFFLTYVQHWKPKASSIHLHAGKSFARGLEVARKVFYTGAYDETVEGQVVTITVEDSLGNADTAIAEGLKALMKAYGNYQCPPDSAKSLERMLGAFEYYWENYPLDLDPENSPKPMANGKRAIEFSFSEPIDVKHPTTGNPILYVGKMDAIYNYAGGVHIIDEKTTTSLGATWSRQWDLRGQFSGYAWGCERAGIKVDGAIVRGVSILKTKYETQQAISYRPEWQINRWYDETCVWIERMIDDYKTGKWLHNFSDTCADFGGCGYMRVCTSQTPDPWLETDYERRRWDPVRHEESVLIVP